MKGERDMLSEMAKEEIANRTKGMTTEELDVTLENIPVQYIAAHLCCRVNLMQYKIQKMQEFVGGKDE